MKGKKAVAVALGMAVVVGGVTGQSYVAPSIVMASEETPLISLTLGENQEIPTYKAGDKNQTLSIKVDNRSQVDVKDVVVRLNPDDNWPFVARKLSYVGTINQIKGGGSETVQFKNLDVLDTVSTKNHILNFSVDYTKEDGKRYHVSNVKLLLSTLGKETNQPAIAPREETSSAGEKLPPVVDTAPPVETGGQGEASQNASVPRVIITGFQTEPKEVKAGSNFKLIIHLKNTSRTTAVKNMLFNLEAPTEGSDANTQAPAFLPSSGSNAIYLNKMGANSSSDIAIMLNAKSDLTQKPYSINLTMKYENQEGTQFDSSGSVSIPIKQNARFEFSEFEMSAETVAVGSEVNVTTNLYNLGRTKLYNVKVNFEGEGISSKELFLGNVEPGATASIDGMLTGEEETKGDGTVKMILSYEDEDGKVVKTEKSFTMMVTPPEVEEVPNDHSEEPVKKKSHVIPIIVGIIVLAGGITGGILYRKKKKDKALEEEGFKDEFDRSTKDE